MYIKILLIALSAAAFSSCTTAYKSGQTPDDVYYSPVSVVNETQNNDRDETKKDNNDDMSVRMRTRDRRWRDLDDDYRYDNSPYHYCTCNCTNYGYYYNPYYYPWPVYTKNIVPVNNTPRKVNLNDYTGLSNTGTINPKGGSGINWVKPAAQYNNSNRSGLGKLLRQIIAPNNSNSSSSGNNNTRTYSPSSGNSGSSGNSNSGSSSSGKVSRPNRGG